MTVSLTLFTTCKPFQNQFTTIQRNALRSWQKLCPPCEVLVFGNEAGVEQCCKELNFRQIVEIERSERGTPLLNHLFQRADRFSSNEYLAYVNADIILTRDVITAVTTAAKRFKQFLLIARRWNVDLNSQWDFQRDDWEGELRRFVTAHGVLEPRHGGVDLFIYPRGLWESLPPFAIGRTRWDSALIYHARRQGLPVIDATEVLTSIHPNHDYSHLPAQTVGHVKGSEARTNEILLGGDEFIFTPLNATHIMNNFGVVRNILLSPSHLLRKIATFPALYPSLRPLAPVVRKLAPLWRQLQLHKIRTAVHSSIDSSQITLPNKKPSLYIFVHLPKTGGTTFHSSYLPQVFSDSERFLINGEREQNAADISRLIHLSQKKPLQLKMIAGHNAFSLRSYLPKANFIVILRNPVDRAISAYMHAKNHLPASEGAQYIIKKHITLKDFVTAPPPEHLYGFGITDTNGQLKALLQPSGEMPEFISDDSLNTLLNQFSFVGLTEQLDLFIFYLHIKIGFPLVLYNNRLVNDESKSLSVSPDQRRLIEDFNQNDVKLYQQAKARFTKDLNEIWSQDTELKWIAFRALLEHFRLKTNHDENRSQKIGVEIVLG